MFGLRGDHFWRGIIQNVAGVVAANPARAWREYSSFGVCLCLSHAPAASYLQGDLKIALRGGGVTWTPAEGGGGVGEMGFRVGPFVLCKNGYWRRRRKNTNFGPKKFFPPIISAPTFE